MFAKKLTESKSDNLHLVESSIKNKGGDDGVRTWSTAVQILLPVAALAFLWGRRGFFARFLLQFDKNCVSVFCPSFSKRQRLLKWASGRLPPTWSSRTNTLPGGPAEFWRDGSLLCTLINSAIPGACPNPYRHWRRSPSHGQALAYKYLGVAPTFTEEDFNENMLTPRSEKLLLDYLIEIQQAIMKISLQEIKFSARYVARGMGLMVGEQYRKTSFYIYSSSTTTASKHDVIVSIRGPYNNSCTATIPAYYATRKYFYDKRLDHQSKAQRSFFRTLSIDFGSFINVSQKQNNVNDIPIKAVSEKDRVKIIFIPQNTGIHEISIITNGFHLVGSPFNVNVIENTTGGVDVFNEGIRYTCRRTRFRNMKRRIISRIIDFIDEKVSYDALKNQSYNRETPTIKVISPSLSQSFSEDENTVDNRNSEVGAETTDAVRIENTINEDIETNVNANFTQESAFISSNDDDNNTSTVSLPFKSPLDSSSNDNATVINTSPICSEHIEKEVTKDVDGTSKTPNRNFKKKPLMRQEKVKIFDSAEESEYEEEEVTKESIDDLLVILENDENKNLTDSDVEAHHIELTSLASEKAYKNNRFINELRENQNYLKQEKLVNIETRDENYKEEYSSRQVEEERFDLKDTNERYIEAAFDYLYESTTIKEEEHQENDGNNQNISQYEIGAMHPDSMNILNFISGLKSEISSSMSSNINEKLKYLDKESLFEHKMNFLECLKYWESQANLHIKEERRQYKSRRSLPNLLAPASSEYSIFVPYFYPKDNYLKSWDSSQDVEFTSSFKERQEYWKQLSSQTTSYSSLSNSISYLEKAFKNDTKNNIIKSRRSLPELFSKTLKEEYLHQVNYRNAFPPDFFNSPEALEFKTKFKECRDFWEKLSNQNLNEDQSYLKYFGKHSSTSENYDSGFYSSFPNLCTNSASKSSFSILTEDPSSLRYKVQYDQTREYWERLSSDQLSHEAVSPFQKCKNFELKNRQSNLFSNTARNKVLEPKHERRKIDVGNDQINLTDDLKQISDYRSKMKVNFNEARRFFKNLEERLN